MSGPLLLGLIGGALVLAAAAWSAVFIGPGRRRYGLDYEHIIDGGDASGHSDGGTDIRQLVADMARVSSVAAIGSALQFIALVWQTARA